MRQATRIALFALLATIWGSTWLAIKVGYGGLGPFNIASLRFFVAGALFLAIAPLTGARFPRGATEWRLVLWVGTTMFALDYGLIYWGEQHIESGLTAVLFATLPLITALCAHVYIPGDRLTARKLGGTLLALVGVIALFADKLRIDPAKALPMLAIIASAFFAALSSVATKRHGAALPAAGLNGPAMLLGAALLALASLATGDGYAFPRDPATWGAVLYLALAGSVVTFLVYFTLLKTWNVTTLSFISVFTPVIALALGLFVLDEPVTAWVALGAALIVAGVALSVSRARGGAPVAAPVAAEGKA